jgi:hypothetical protein
MQAQSSSREIIRGARRRFIMMTSSMKSMSFAIGFKCPRGF